MKTLFQSKLWLFPLGYILFFLIEAIADVFYGQKSLHLYIIFVFLSFLILMILAIVKSFREKSDVHWWAVVLAFLLLFFWQDMRENTSLLMRALKIQLMPQVFSECIRNATPIPLDGAIGICEYKRSEIWYAVNNETIIYDSSDQIIKKHANRPPAWNRTAFQLFDKKFHNTGYTAKKLFGHYYYVYFSTALHSGFKPEDHPEDYYKKRK